MYQVDSCWNGLWAYFSSLEALHLVFQTFWVLFFCHFPLQGFGWCFGGLDSCCLTSAFSVVGTWIARRRSFPPSKQLEGVAWSPRPSCVHGTSWLMRNCQPVAPVRDPYNMNCHGDVVSLPWWGKSHPWVWLETTPRTEAAMSWECPPSSPRQQLPSYWRPLKIASEGAKALGRVQTGPGWALLVVQKYSGFCWVYMGVSINGGTQQPLVFLPKMIILGCFWGTTIFGNTHISQLQIEQFKELDQWTNVLPKIMVHMFGATLMTFSLKGKVHLVLGLWFSGAYLKGKKVMTSQCWSRKLEYALLMEIFIRWTSRDGNKT